MLEKMRLAGAENIMQSYPFQLFGGMRQRVGIAMAMIYDPKLLLADDPTSALDVTTQAQIVRQMMELRDTYGTSIIVVTHNLGVAAYMSDKTIACVLAVVCLIVILFECSPATMEDIANQDQLAASISGLTLHKIGVATYDIKDAQIRMFKNYFRCLDVQRNALLSKPIPGDANLMALFPKNRAGEWHMEGLCFSDQLYGRVF